MINEVSVFWKFGWLTCLDYFLMLTCPNELIQKPKVNFNVLSFICHWNQVYWMSFGHPNVFSKIRCLNCFLNRFHACCLKAHILRSVTWNVVIPFDTVNLECSKDVPTGFIILGYLYNLWHIFTLCYSNCLWVWPTVIVEFYNLLDEILCKRPFWKAKTYG